MKNRVFCPVCQVEFIYREEVKEGKELVCLVCGAGLEITATGDVSSCRRLPLEPETEIRDRLENFARLRGYDFGELKEEYIEGMLSKFAANGDFYCPCRFDNVPENICPCLETRMNAVKKQGSCHCGLFVLSP